MQTRVYVGPRIKELRIKAALTQADLAAKAGLAVNTVARLERGEAGAHMTSARKLAKAFGVKPADLLPDTPGGISANVMAPIRVGFGGNTVQLKTLDEYRATTERLRRFVRAAEEGREDGSEYRDVMEALDEFSTAHRVMGRGEPEHPAVRETDALAHELHGLMVELRAEYERRGRAAGDRLEGLAKTA